MLESEGLENGDLVTFMDDKGYDWQIWTEIQKKDAEGNFVTVSRTYENDQADQKNGSFVPEEDGTYRIAKILYASTYGSLDYKFTAVSDEVTVGGGQVSVDKSQLQAAIEEAKALTQGDKTDEAWEKLQSAIASAEDIMNQDTDEETIAAAEQALQAAVAEFRESAPETTDPVPEDPDDQNPDDQNPDNHNPDSQNPDDTDPDQQSPGGNQNGGSQNIASGNDNSASGTDTQNSEKTELKQSVKTGDSTMTALWSAAALGGAALAAGAAAMRKRRETE